MPIEFPPKSSSKQEREAPLDLPGKFGEEPEPIVMLNPVLSAQAEGRKLKRPTSVSMGGNSYVPKVFESIDGTAAAAPAPDTTEEARPAPPVAAPTPETKREYKMELGRMVRSLEEIEEHLTAKRTEAQQIEKEASTPGIKESARFQQQQFNAETGVAEQTAATTLSPEERMAKVEAEIHALEREKRSVHELHNLTAANDNEQLPVGTPVPVFESVAQEPTSPVLAEEPAPPVSDATRPAKGKVLQAGLAAAAAIAASTTPSVANPEAPTPAVAEAPARPANMPTSPEAKPEPIKIPVQAGDGADKLFLKLQTQLTTTYKDAAHAPNPVAKKIMESAPNALSRSFDLAAGDKSATLYEGDTLELTPTGELVFSAKGKVRVLMDSSAKTKGPFVWPRMFRFGSPAAPAAEAPAGAAAPEADRSAEIAAIYAKQIAEKGLPPNTDQNLGQLRAQLKAETVAPAAPQPQPAPEHAPAPEPVPEPVPEPAPAPEPIPATPSAAPSEAVAPAPLETPVAPEPAVPDMPESALKGPAPEQTSFTNENGVLIDLTKVQLYAWKLPGTKEIFPIVMGGAEADQLAFVEQVLKTRPELGGRVLMPTRNPVNGVYVMQQYSLNEAGSLIIPVPGIGVMAGETEIPLPNPKDLVSPPQTVANR